jgi:Domain of unknown function (DUF3291)
MSNFELAQLNIAHLKAPIDSPILADFVANLDRINLNFVYHPAHAEIMKRRREWFAHAPQAYAVLWWVPSGHRPSLSEAADRLERLRQHGPSSTGFTFGRIFSAPATDPAPVEWPATPATASAPGQRPAQNRTQ